MKSLLFLLVAMVLLTGCKRKKSAISGDEPVQPEDFIGYFALANLPYEVADSTMQKKDKDSLLISYPVFKQFVPDTFLVRYFRKDGKPKLYPLKRVEVEGETYLFVKSILAGKKIVYILAFDKKKKFAGLMEFLKTDNDPSTFQLSGMDRRLNIYKMVYKKRKDGSTDEGKEVFVFSPEAGQFILIMTDILDDNVNEVFNPIDTLAKKNKFSGDYIKDKMNIVSVRDGNRPGRINFFIHIEKRDGCSGELKGEALLKSAGTAEYRIGGDPCVLQLNFTSSSVVVKELKACGNRREVKCSFDGTFPKKKPVKPKPAKKKK